MFLSSWRKLIHLVRSKGSAAERQQRRGRSRWLWVEALEERMVLSSIYQWNGNGTSWSTPADWTIVAGTGDTNFYPSLPGDVAQFNAVYPTAQTVTVDAPGISVSEIDFGAGSAGAPINITINSDGTNFLTLDNNGGAAILTSGTTFLNFGADIINVPLRENTADNTTLTASVGANSLLNLTNTATAPNPAIANNFTAADTFTVTASGTLEFQADPTHSALGSAGVLLNGGTLQIDASPVGAATIATAVSVAAGSANSLTVGTLTGTSPITLSKGITFGGSGDALAITGPPNGPLTLGSLNLAPVAGDSLTLNASSVTVNALTGANTGSVTVGGTGVLSLPNSNSGSDSAAMTLNGVTLSLGNNNALGTGPITLSSGAIQSSAGALNLPNSVSFSNNGSAAIVGSSPLTLSGLITLNGNDTLAQNDAGGLTLSDSNNFAGAGTISFAGVDTVTLNYTISTNTNTVNLSGATLILNNVSQLGTGTLSLTSGTLQTAAAITSLNNVAFANTGTASLVNASPLTLGGTIADNGNVTLTLAGPPIALAAGTTFTGTGAVTLSGNTTVTVQGVLTIPATSSIGLNGITLVVGTSNALGLGGLIVNSATLQDTSSSAMLLSNPIALNANGSLTLVASAPLLLDGAVSLAAGNDSIFLNNTTTTFLGGVVSGAGNLTLGGSGTVVLSGVNTYFGTTTTLMPGIDVQAQNGAAFGSGAVIVNPGSGVTILANANLNNSFTLSGSGFNGGGAIELLSGNDTLSGNITLAADTTFGTDNNSTLTLLNTGTLSGTANLIKVGAGTLLLAGSDGGFSGNTTINAGIVNVSTSSGLGTGPASVTVANGATLQLAGGSTVAGLSLTLSGSGYGYNGTLPQGALTSVDANDNTWAGPITLAANTTIGAALGSSTLTIGGNITGSFSLTAVGPGAAVLAGNNSFANNLTVQGAFLTLQGTNSYTGTTTVSGAVFGSAFVGGTLDLNTSGQLTGTPGPITVNQNSMLELDNTVTSVANRLNDASVTLNSASFTLLANNNGSAITTETLSNITLNSGLSTINAGFTSFAGTAVSTLSVATLSRVTGATVNFVGGPANVTPLGTSSNQILFANLSANPTSTTPLQYVGNQGNILPYAEVNGAGGANLGDFATYTANGIAAFSNYAIETFSAAGSASFAAGDIAQIVIPNTASASFTITGPTTAVGALLIDNQSAINVTFTASSPGATVTSGTIMTESATGAGTITLAGTYNFTGETTLFQNALGTGNTTFTGAIAGSGPLNIAGVDTVSLGTNSNTTFTGGVDLESGTLITANNGNFGSGAITLTGGALSTTTASTTYSNAVNLNGVVTFMTNQPVFSGTITLVGNSYLTATSSVLFNGSIGGSGTLTVVSGAGSVILNNINTYTGGTTVAGGILQVGNNGALGTSTLTLAAGTIEANSGVVVNNPVLLSDGTVTVGNLNGNDLTFAGPITLIGTNTLTINSTGLTSLGTTTGSGGLTGVGSLTLAGAQTSQLPTANPNFTGGLTLSAGNLIVGNNGALGAGLFTLSGGTLFGSTTITISNNTVISGNATVSGEKPLTFTGTINLEASPTLTVNDWAGVTVAGLITESGAARTLTAGGTGTLTLLNTSGFTGGLTENMGGATGAGTLVLGTAAAAGVGTLTLTTGVLQTNVAGGITILNAVALNSNSTPVVFTGNPIVFTGKVQASKAPLLLLNNKTTFAGAAAIAGQVPVTLSNTPVVSTLTNGLSTVYMATGNLVVQGTDNSGSIITVNGGTLTLNNAGILSGNATLNIDTGGTVVVDNVTNGTTVDSRLGTGFLNLNGGTLRILGGSASLIEDMSALTLNAGSSTVIVSKGAGTISVTFTSINQTLGGTLDVVAQGANFDTSTNQVIIGIVPSNLQDSVVGSADSPNTILPFVTTTSINGAVDYAAVDPATGSLIPLSSISGSYYSSIAAAVASGNTNTAVMETSSETSTLPSGSVTIGALLLAGNNLDIGKAGITLNLNNPAGYSGPVAIVNAGTASLGMAAVNFGALEGLLDSASGTLTTTDGINNTVLTGSGGLTIAGPGAVTLTAANTYSGTTTLASGTLTLSSASALPVMTPLSLIGGTLQTTVSGGVTLSNPVTFTNSVVAFAGNNPFYFDSTLTISGAANGPNNIISVTNTGGTTFAGQAVNGAVAASGLTIEGGGTLYLTDAIGAASSFTGQVTIVSGIVNAESANALGATTGVVVAGAGAALQLQSAAPFALARPVVLYGTGVNGRGAVESVFGNDTISGTIALTAPATIGSDADILTVSGIISGPGDLTKVGAGTLALTAANTYFGQTSINAGIVTIATSASALGSVVGSATVAAGASLQLNSNTAFLGKSITLNGNGIAGTLPGGALVALLTITTISANINLNTGATIGVASGFTLTDAGIVSGADLTKVGAGTLVLGAADTYTGNTTVVDGNLTFNDAGSALSTSSINLYTGATLQLDNNGNGNTTAVNLSNRINNSAPVTFDGGTLNFVANPGTGSASTTSSQVIGPVTLASGQAVIEAGWTGAPASGSTSALTINSLTRNTGATAMFLGDNVDITTSLQNQIVFTHQPALTGTIGNQILPYALVGTVAAGGTDFATTSAAAPFNLVHFANYNTSAIINNATPGSVYELTANQTLTGSLSLNGLLISGSGLALGGAASTTLTLTGGALAFAGTGDSLIGATLALGSSEGIITTGASTTTAVIYSTVTGSGANGLTLGGLGTVTLSGANTYTGITNLDGGTLDLGIGTKGSPGSITSGPIGVGVIDLNGGSIQSSSALTLANAFVLDTSNITINGSNNLTFTGSGTVIDNPLPSGLSGATNVFASTLTVSSSALTTFSGAVGGSGSLILAGTGVTYLTGQSTYSGGAFLTAGTVILGANTVVNGSTVQSGPLGAGTVTFTGGSLLADASGRTLANSIELSGATEIIGGSGANGTSASNSTITLSGAITVASATTLDVLTTVTVNGSLGGPGLLTIGGQTAAAGPGNLVLDGNDSAYTGGITLNDGSLGALGMLTVGSANPNPNFALGSGPLTLTNGQLVNNSGGTVIWSTTLNITAGYLKFGGANAIIFRNSQANALSGTSTITVNTPTTIDASLTGAGGLTLYSDGTGSGTSTLALTEADSFTGAVTLASGTLSVSGSGTLAATVYNLDVGGNLTLDDTQTQAGINPQRIPNTTSTSINFNGGTLEFLGSNVTGVASSLSLTSDTITFNSGYSAVINVTGSGANDSTTLNLGAIVRNPGAIINFQGGLTGSLQTLNTTTNQITYTSATTSGSGANAIIVGAVVNDGTTSITVSGANTASNGFNLAAPAGSSTFSVVALTAYAAFTPTGNTGANVYISGSDSYSAGTTGDSPNALLFAGGALGGAGSDTVTVASGMIASASGNNTISVNTVALGGADGKLFTKAGATMILGSLITGTGGLTIAGSGTLSLPNANVTASDTASFTGTTTLDGGSTANSGTLLLGTNDAIPTSSTITLVNGFIGAGVLSGGIIANSSGPITLTNTIAFGSASVATAASYITFGAGGSAAGAAGNSNSLIFSGGVTLNGLSAVLTSNIGNATTPGLPPGAIFTGIIAPGTGSNTTLIKQGSGSLMLTAANTYTGVTLINQGVVNIQNATALGPVADGQVVVASGATVQLENAVVTTKPLILNGAGVTNGSGVKVGALENVTGSADTWTGTIALLGPTSVGVDVGQLSLSGVISGDADLTKVGGGTLVISGVANTYTGQTNVTAGIVSLGNAASNVATTLGSIAGGASVSLGATLQLNPTGATTYAAKSLTLNGSGFGLFLSGLLSPMGALQNNAAFVNTWTGNIVLSTSSTISNAAVAADALTITGAISDNSGSGGAAAGLTKVGIGTLALAAANTYTGATIIAAGTLDLNSDGSLLNTSSITVNDNSNGTGATLLLDNSSSTSTVTVAGNLVNRVGDNIPIVLNGGLLSYVGSNLPGAMSSETLGNVSLASGSSTISSTAGVGGSVQITVAALARSTGATVDFVGGNQALGSAGNQIEFLTPPVMTNGILPYATVQSPSGSLDLASYGATQTIAFGSVSSGAFQLSFNGANTTAIAWSANALTLAANIQAALAALPGIGNGNIAVSGSGPFTVNFLNALANASPAQIAVFSNSLTGTLPTITTSTTSNTASIAAFANYKTNLALAGPTDNVKVSDSEFLTGNMTVNAVLVSGTNTETLGNFTLTLASGSLVTSAGSGATFTGGTLNFGAAEGILVTNSNVTINSAIAGAGGLTISDTGTSTVALNATGTYTSTGLYSTIFNGPGTLSVGAGAINTSSALGTGRLLLTGGTLGTAATGATGAPVNGVAAVSENQFALANPITFNDNSVVTLGASAVNMTFTGPIALGISGGMVSLNAGGANAIGVVLAGLISGGDSLNLIGGSGLLVLPGANTYGGGTNIGGGTLFVESSSILSGETILSGPLGTGPLNLMGGTIQSSDLADLGQPFSVSAVTIANPIVLTNANVSIGGVAAASEMLSNTTMTFSGSITVSGATNTLTINNKGTINANGIVTPSIYFSGNIGGTGGLTFKSLATGFVQLSGNSTFTGGLTLNPTTASDSITVAAGSSSAFGAGLVTLNSTATTTAAILQISASQTIANNLLLIGAFPNVLEAANTSSTSATFTGTIGGTGNLQIGQANLAGASPSNSPGTVVFAAAETYTGTTTVDQGTLDLNSNGTILESNTIVVNQGARLQLDNTGTNNVNRLSDSAGLTLVGGTFNFLGAANAASGEVLGSLTIGSATPSVGQATIISNAAAGGTAALDFTGTFTRDPGTLVNFQAGTTGSETFNTTTNQIIFSSSSVTMTNSVIIGATVTDATTVAQGATTGITAALKMATATASSAPANIVALTAYVAPASGSATTNVLVNSSTVTLGSGTTTYNSLLLLGNSDSIGGAGAIATTTGMIVTSGATTSADTIGGSSTIALGAIEGEIIDGAGSTLTISGVISGSVSPTTSAGLTVGGSGALNITLPSPADAYSGILTLNSGTVGLGASGILPTGTVTIVASVIQCTVTAGATLSDAIALNTGTGAATFSGSNPLTLSGVISGTGSLVVNPAASDSLTFAGTANNTFSGITTVNTGTLVAGKTANVAALEGTLIIGSSSTLGLGATQEAGMLNNAATNLILGGTFNTSGNNMQIGGNLVFGGSGSTSPTFVAAATATLTWNGTNVIALPNSTTSLAAATVITVSLGTTSKVFNIGAGSSLTLTTFTSTAGDIDNLTKIGSGTVTLAGAAANSYSTGSSTNVATNGVTTVNEGALQFAKTAAVAAVTGPVVVGDFSGNATVQVATSFSQLGIPVNVFVNAGGTFIDSSTSGQTIGTLDVRGGIVSIGSDTLTPSGGVDGLVGNGGSATIASGATGQLVLGANQTFTVADDGGTTPGLIVNAVITGTNLGLTKLGEGTLLLAPPASDSFGATTVSEGTLLLGATGSTVTIPGSLQVGDSIGGDSMDVVGLVNGSGISQIAGTAAVTVNNSGLLYLNNAGASIGSLTMQGGSVSIGSGATLTLNGNVASLFSPANLDDPYTATGVNQAIISGSGTISLAGSTTIDVQTGLGSVIDAATGKADLADMIINPAIAGGSSVTLTKQDSGILKLTGTSPLSGATAVNGGILLVDGSLANSSVTVNTGATLGGTGAVGPTNVAGGTVNPGDPISGTSTLTFNGPVNFSNGGNLTVEVTGNSSAGFRADLLNLGSNTLILGGTSSLTVDLNGLTGFANSPITIITDGATVGTFTSVNLINNPNNSSVSVSYNANAITLNASNPLLVSTFTPTATGFTASFNRAFLNTSTNPIHLYSAVASNANYGPPDVTLVGPNGTVAGSLIVNSSNTGFTFIKTNVSTTGGAAGLLAPGTYTVTFLSSSTGFQDTSGNLLNNGTNYTTTFTVTSPPPAAVTVSIPDFARGPDSTPADSINLTNNTSNGVPITLSIPAGDLVTSGSVTINYSTSLLTIAGAFPNPSLNGLSFTLSGSSSPGTAIVNFSSSTALGSSSATVNVNLGGLIAYTPNSAVYKSKELLQIVSSLNGGAIPTINDNAVQVVAYLGNVSGTGFYSGLDSGEMLNVISGSDVGFSQFPVIDPVILGGITGDNQVAISDVLQLNSRIATGSNPFVPPIPSISLNNPAGPDPTLSIPAALTVSANGTVLVPVNIDDAMPAGSTGMTVAQLALRYDPTDFSVMPQDVQLGSVPESGTGWTLRTVVDPSTGTIGITLFSETPIDTTTGGSLALIALHELSTATPGATGIELMASVTANGQVYSTSVNDQQGPFTLTPAPTNTGAAPGLEGTVVLAGGNTAATTVGNNAGGEPIAVLPAPATLQNAPPMASGSVAIPVSTLEIGPDAGVQIAVDEPMGVPDPMELVSVALATPEIVPVSALTQAPLGVIETAREQNPGTLPPPLGIDMAASGYAFAITAAPAPAMFASLPNFGAAPAQRAADQVFLTMGDSSQGPTDASPSDLAALDGCFAKMGENDSPDGE